MSSNTQGSSNNIIGRIVISRDKPAKPNEFWGWVKSDKNIQLEVGTVLTVEGEGSKIIATIEDMESISDIPDRLHEFYGFDYGNPLNEPSTKPQVIKYIKLRVISRDPKIFVSPDDRFKIRFVNSNDIDIFIRDIPQDKRVLGGFLKVNSDEKEPSSWLPVFLHADYLLGPEGAHVNITGKSGLATKTSYALFLSYAILAWAKANDKKVAIVLFNVKSRDFLRLHKLPDDWAKANEWIEKWVNKIGDIRIKDRIKALWEQTKNYVDVLAIKPDVYYFTYRGDPDMNNMVKPVIYSYGFHDLSREEFITALFHRVEPTDPQLNLLDVYLERYLLNNTSMDHTFDMMLDNLRNVSQVDHRYYVQITGVQGTHNRSTVRALFNRLNGFLSRTSNIIVRNAPRGIPITFNNLRPNSLHVIQLYRLDDSAKRLIVNNVIRRIREGLEAQTNEIERVVVITDELNKYAPKSGESSIKEQIIDIVARGRDVRLSLIGAQQFASEIDSEVYGNCSTKAVGCSDTSEISDAIYRYLGDLKEQVPYLNKGEIMLYHSIYTMTVMKVFFPPPLHVMSDN
jgi:hypothetical protein